MNTQPKLVDIVIPVHNRWQLTKQTLDTLLANTDKEKANIYVIDDGCDEEPRRLLQEYNDAHQDRFQLLVNETAIAPGPSRNLVCQMITHLNNRSQYLYHSDNDVYFTSGWLETLVGKFETISSRIKLLGGGCHPYLQNKMEPEYRGFGVGIKDAVSGYSQLMTWETWDKYGPFEENMRDAEIKIMGSEDWAFCQRIVKDGFLVGSIEPEVVIHCGKTNTYGNPATGHETFRDIPGIIIE